MILQKEVINYFWLSEVIFQQFCFQVQTAPMHFLKIYSRALIGVRVAYSGFWLESWMITFHGQAEGQWVKEKWFNLHSFSSSDTCGTVALIFLQRSVRLCTFIYPPSHIYNFGMNRSVWNMAFGLQTQGLLSFYFMALYYQKSLDCVRIAHINFVAFF